MELVAFAVVGIALYLAADAILDWLERLRGARFENRQVVYFAIILPLALAAFWLIRRFFGPPGP